MSWGNQLSDHAAHTSVQACSHYHGQHLILRVFRIPHLLQIVLIISNPTRCMATNTGLLGVMVLMQSSAIALGQALL